MTAAKKVRDHHITLRSPDEIELLGTANRIVADTLNMLGERIEAGRTTFELDHWAEEFVRDHQAIPAFKGYHGFPGCLCVSINQEVVHGIPSKKIVLREGDLVSIDFGVKYQGYFGDAAVTIPLGEVQDRYLDLLRVTRQALYEGISQALVGKRVNDVGRAVQEHVEAHGFSVVRQFVGHGIGTQLHESPEVPNFVRDGRSPRLQAGMVLAIEPMVNLGSHEVRVLRDGWTVVTADGMPSAHFEHSVAVTEEGPRILSEGIRVPGLD